ncbi:MAG TPA: ATP-binding protein [Polyangiaceae bacterium]|nr:ATP-binding protein [Polyangiaceae bacterium]
MNLKWVDEASLRQLAEQRLASSAASGRVPESKDHLVHELLVHQAELEMQNEALRDAHAELLESQQRFQDLFDSAPVGYVVLDASSRIQAANPLARDILGRGVVGRRLTHYLVPDEAVVFERYRRQVLASPDRFSGEFTLIDVKGRRREMRIDGVRTSAVAGTWRAALIDVSEQNATSRRLNHSERLEAVGEHASGIAHDLNNLLYSVAVHLEVALRSLDDGHSAHHALQQLRTAVERCSATTEQLASFSRSETEQPSIVDLNVVIGSMESVLRSILGDDVELELDLAARDPSIRVAEKDVEQILLSAARNAQHAMQHGGTFCVETETVVLGTHLEQGTAESVRYVRWTLSDDGMGMSESTRRRAFEPFFTTKPAGSGTGLGLSLVKAIVERAGGSALLESELGRGTSLVIHLPCASASSRVSSWPPPNDE